MSEGHQQLPLPLVSDGEGLDRRGFLTRSMQLAVLSVLASSCGGLGSPTGVPSFSQPLTIKLSDYPALAQAGGVASVSGAGLPLAVANLGGGQYGAYSLICPHQGGLVQWTGSQFVCPVHGARFDLQGDWQGGQPTSGLQHYSASYDAASDTLTIQP